MPMPPGNCTRFLAVIALAGAACLAGGVAPRAEEVPGGEAAIRPRLVAETKHSGSILCFAFSREAGVFATGGADHAIKVRDSGSGREILTVAERSGTIESIALSGDGRLLACSTGPFTGTVDLWDVASGTLLHTFRVEPAGGKSSVALSPDGTLLAAGGGYLGKTAHVWSTESYKELYRFEDGSIILSMKISASNELFTCALFGSNEMIFQDDGNHIPVPGASRVTVRDLKDGRAGRADDRVVKKFEVDLDVVATELTPDGRTLFGRTDDHRVVVWDVAEARVTGVLGKPFRVPLDLNGATPIDATLPLDRDWTLAANAAGTRVAMGMPSLLGKNLYVYEVPGKEPVRRIALEGRCAYLGFLFEDDTLLAGSESEATRFLDAGGPVLPGHRALIGDPGAWDRATKSQIIWSSRLGPDGTRLAAVVSDLPDDSRDFVFFRMQSLETVVGDSIQVWDLANGRLGRSLRPRRVDRPLDRLLGPKARPGPSLLGAGLDAGGGRVVGCYDDGSVDLWSLAPEQPARRLREPERREGDPVLRVYEAAFLGDRTVVTGGITGTELIDVEDPGRTRVLAADGPPGPLALSADGALLCKNDVVWRTATGESLSRLKYESEELSIDGYVTALSFNPGGDRLAGAVTARLFSRERQGAIVVWKTDSGEIDRVLVTDEPVGALAYDDRARVVAGTDRGNLFAWDPGSGAVQGPWVAHDDRIRGLTFHGPSRRLATSSSDNRVKLWDLSDPLRPREVASLFTFPGGHWAVVDPSGRLDTDDLDRIEGLHWVMPDDAFHPLAPEVFLRDYFEPRLLPRLLDPQERPRFRPVRPLAELNRLQPGLKIVGVARGPRPECALVEVEVASVAGTIGRPGRPARTDAYDLRLFRDGQLVGRWPEVADDRDVEPDPASPEQMRAWRCTHRIEPGSDGTSRRTFPVRLPHRDAPGPVEFSAYAFNEDRVKSATATASYEAPAAPAAGKPRAYLIAMGVGACQTRHWDLRFAVADARLILDDLGAALERAGRFKVVPVPLLSRRSPGGAVREATATKAHLKAALARLAGAEAALAVPGGGDLQVATPDDLVLVTFSGHGYTDDRGQFYLVPYDVGGEHATITAALPNCISAAELSAWLRPVDAGSVTLIVDACHSAAAIQQEGFKPGPLGSRGLGQLAYDKGMRVLAASQAEAVALESARVRQGLLTYALVKDGLQHERAARGGAVTLGGLLAYAAGRVPTLYAEVRQGHVRDAQGREVPEVVVPRQLGDGGPGGGGDTVQRPELFDYAKVADVVLARPGSSRPAPIVQPRR